MSNLKLKEEKVTGLWNHKLSDPEFNLLLKKYRKLLSSVYGPNGQLVVICNSAGRNTLASTSSQIIQQSNFFHPVIKYINALVRAQNSICGLYGLFTGTLCSWMLEEFINCETNIPYSVIQDINDWIISEIFSSLNESPTEITFTVDVGCMEQLMSFVRTIISSKGSCGLNQHEESHLCLQIIKVFLKSIPKQSGDGKFGHIDIIEHAGPSTLETQVYDGILYPEPFLSTESIKKFPNIPEGINLLLFTVPLSCAVDEAEQIAWTGINNKEEAFLDKIIVILLKNLKQKNVHILANQKFIHPVIKFELERAGFIILERLGTKATNSLMRMCQCKPISKLSNLVEDIKNSDLGVLSSVKHVICCGKSYIFLDPREECLATLLLTCISTDVLENLKEKSRSCLDSLRSLVLDHTGVAGGGCLEAWLGSQIKIILSKNVQVLPTLLNTTLDKISQVSNIYIRIFMGLAMHLAGGPSKTRFDWSIDSVFHHLWYTPSKSSCLLTDRNKLDDVNSKLNNTYNGRVNNPSNLASMHMDTKENGKSLERCACGMVQEYQILDRSGKWSVICFDDCLERNEDILQSECNLMQSISFENIGNSSNYPIEVDNIIYFNKNYIKVDSFTAKYNALRIALEGFTQLSKVNVCIFDK